MFHAKISVFIREFCFRKFCSLERRLEKSTCEINYKTRAQFSFDRVDCHTNKMSLPSQRVVLIIIVEKHTQLHECQKTLEQRQLCTLQQRNPQNVIEMNLFHFPRKSRYSLCVIVRSRARLDRDHCSSQREKRDSGYFHIASNGLAIL